MPITDHENNPDYPSSLSLHPSKITIFAHTLDAIHRRRLDGVGRVWLLLRHLDQKGEGRVTIKWARHLLSDPSSRLKCLSKKRVQQLIRQGEKEGFWHRCKRQRWLYLHSEPRVVATLGVKRIGGWALDIAIADLLQPLKAVRALFYDAFHSGRGENEQDPITRKRLQERGMVEAHTQRKYEKLRGIDPQANYATITKYSRAAWQRAQHEEDDDRVGGPAFIYIDYKGVLGKNPQRHCRQAKYRHWHNIFIMRRIGNAYTGTLQTAKRGRRWTNHKLKHLCQSMSLMGSFEHVQVERRFYYRSEDAAHKAAEQNNEQPLYNCWEATDESQGNLKTDCSGYWLEWLRDQKENNQKI
ncbi:MAG: hypothetical protein AAF633_26795 [Chloroflexota bacterium]